jgi:hypothetical protein
MLYERVFRNLSEGKVRYLIGGGIAVNLHGFFRATGDLDLLVAFDPDNLSRFLQAIKSLGFRPKIPVAFEQIAAPGAIQAWRKKKGMKVLSFFNPKQSIEQVDVLVDVCVDFDRAWENRETVLAAGMALPLISIDDLILLKRAAGRERDRIDIEALLEIKKIKNGQKSGGR